VHGWWGLSSCDEFVGGPRWRIRFSQWSSSANQRYTEITVKTSSAARWRHRSRDLPRSAPINQREWSLACDGERIFKVGPNLAKLWTRIAIIFMIYIGQWTTLATRGHRRTARGSDFKHVLLITWFNWLCVNQCSRKRSLRTFQISKTLLFTFFWNNVSKSLK